MCIVFVQEIGQNYLLNSILIYNLIITPLVAIMIVKIIDWLVLKLEKYNYGLWLFGR
ncbi:MAG: hypothetical protein R3Y47_00415 [Lachnospiraceae bacterium]